MDGLWWDNVELDRGDVVANILCRDHNSALSPLDETGGRIIERLEQADALQEARHKIAEQEPRAGLLKDGRRAERWEIRSYSVNRPSLERLLVKLAINSAVAGEQLLGENATTCEPPRELVEFVFGRGPKPRNLIFGMATTIGTEVEVKRCYRVAFINTWRDGAPEKRFVAAAVITLANSFHFVVSFNGTLLPKRAIASALNVPTVDVVHLGGLNFNVAKRLSHKVVFQPAAERPEETFPE